MRQSLLIALRGLVFAAFAAAMLAGMLSYGGVTERGGAAIALLALLAGMMAALGWMAEASWAPVHGALPGHPPRRFQAALVAALAGLVLWGGLQMIPMPMGLLRLISPAAAAWHGEFGLLGDGFPPRLSLDPEATRRALAQLVAILLAGFAAWWLGQLPRWRDAGFLLILASAGGALVYGVLELMGLAGSTYGWRVLSGPFINRNHCGALMALATPLAAGWTLTLILRQARRHANRGLPYGWGDVLNSVLVLSLLPPLFLAGGCLLTLSRGAMAALVLALAAWLLMCFGHRALGWRAWLWPALSTAGVAGAMLVAGSEPLLRRFEETGRALDAGEAYSRAQLWKDTIAIVADFPLAGSGLGSYYGVYMPYSSVSTGTLPIHAHSDWLQVAAEAGLPGLALMLTALMAYLLTERRLLRPTLTARTERPLRAGAVAGVLAMALHAAGEFPLRLPLLALIFAVLAGLSLATGERPSMRRHMQQRG